MTALSLCMIAKNEEEWIGKCLEASEKFVDEIVIVDTGSSDRTKEIAGKFGAKIFDFKWSDDFSAARNESIKHASGDWIIYIDADEVISCSSWKKIRELIKDGKADAYLLYQRNYTNDKTVFGWKPNDEYDECRGGGFFVSPITRLFRNRKGYSFSYKIHETPDPSILEKKGAIKNSRIPVHHYGYLKDAKVLEGKRAKYLKLGLEQIKATPSNPRPYYEVAGIYKATGKFSEAEKFLKKVAELNPDYKLVYTNLGEVYTKQGKIREAIEAYRESISRKKDENAYINLAMLSYQLGNLQDGIKLFEKAIGINPLNPVAYNNLGLVMLKAKKYKAALAVFDRAFEKTRLEKFRQAADSIRKRFKEPLKIEELLKEKKYSELEKHLLERIKKNPKDVIAYTYLGNLFLKLGKKRKALRILQDAVSRNKTRNRLCINLHVNLANLLFEMGNPEKAEETIKNAVEIAPEDEFLKKKLEFIQKSL